MTSGINWLEKEKQALLAQLSKDTERQEKMYLDYLKQINNPKPGPYKSMGLFAMMKEKKKEPRSLLTISGLKKGLKEISQNYHEHSFVATHTVDEHGVMIWKCSCGMKTSSM